MREFYVSLLVFLFSLPSALLHPSFLILLCLSGEMKSLREKMQSTINDQVTELAQSKSVSFPLFSAFLSFLFLSFFFYSPTAYFSPSSLSYSNFSLFFFFCREKITKLEEEIASGKPTERRMFELAQFQAQRDQLNNKLKQHAIGLKKQLERCECFSFLFFFFAFPV
jgi:hypothetical protein